MSITDFSEQDFSYLVQHFQRNRVEEIFHDDAQDGTLTRHHAAVAGRRRVRHVPRVHGADGLQGGLGSLQDKSQSC